MSPYNAMTVSQLHTLCQKYDIPYRKSMRKNEIVKRLDLHDLLTEMNICLSSPCVIALLVKHCPSLKTVEHTPSTLFQAVYDHPYLLTALLRHAQAERTQALENLDIIAQSRHSDILSSLESAKITFKKYNIKRTQCYALIMDHQDLVIPFLKDKLRKRKEEEQTSSYTPPKKSTPHDATHDAIEHALSSYEHHIHNEPQDEFCTIDKALLRHAPTPHHNVKTFHAIGRIIPSSMRKTSRRWKGEKIISGILKTNAIHTPSFSQYVVFYILERVYNMAKDDLTALNTRFNTQNLLIYGFVNTKLPQNDLKISIRDHKPMQEINIRSLVVPNVTHEEAQIPVETAQHTASS